MIGYTDHGTGLLDPDKYNTTEEEYTEEIEWLIEDQYWENY